MRYERCTVTNTQDGSRLRTERLPAVMARTGCGRSFIYALIAKGDFPPPLKIGRLSVWDARDIDAWIDSLSAKGKRSASMSGD